MKKTEILRRAALTMKRFGLCKGEYSTPDGRHCMLGALSVHHDGHVDWHAMVKEIEEDVLDGASIPGWSDGELTTADDVIVALDAAYVLALQRSGIEPEDVL